MIPVFGDYAYSANGVHSLSEKAILDYTQENMVIGQGSQFIHGASDVATVILNGTTKELSIDSVSANVIQFNQPLPANGLFKVTGVGTYTSSYNIAKIDLIETNGSTVNVFKNWTNSGSALSMGSWIYVEATTGYSVYLRVTTNHTTDTMKFSELSVTHIPNQI